MAAVTIDELQLQIQANSSSAASSIDALSSSLNRLRIAARGGVGLTAVSKQISQLALSLNTLNFGNEKVLSLVEALKPLMNIGKSNLGSTLNQLKKIPEITAGLDNAKLSEFSTKILQVTEAVRPLAIEMEKVSAGFSKLPANIQRAINANAKLTTSNAKASKSYGILGSGISWFYAKLSLAYIAARRIANVIADWISESNSYIENLNLFTVAMGEYASSAQEYAEQVGDLLGIDPSVWMRNQGVFMTLATGFGIATEKAALMSKNLTQLGYDISSFFNISVEDSMQKLQSGLSGELEPLRRLGYDLSQAKLEAIALSLGIDKSVSSMTQAEKAQLRYYAILTQVTTAQGDMARTLESPANQLRILSAQVTQASRALGNIFIPILNKVLPYAIAFLKVTREVANTIATIAGFTLPEVDYSGLTALTSSSDDATDALDNTTESAKELQKTLMGFDELNVINSSSLADSVNDLTDAFNFDLPEYDFLSGLTESKISGIVEDMKEWFGLTGDITSWSELMDTKFGNILKTVGLIAAGLLLWKVTKDFSSVLGTLSNLKLSGVAGLVLTIASVKLLYDGITALFDDSVDNDLLGAVKTAIGASLLGAGLSLVLGKGLIFSLELGLLFASVALMFTGIKSLFDSSPENDLLGEVTTALGAALGGASLGLITKAGLKYTIGLSLLFASVALAFEGIKKLFDSSTENDLLGAVQAALGASLGGAALTLLVGKGLSFSVGVAFAIASATLLFAGIKGLFDNDPSNDLLSAVTAGIGSALGGALLKNLGIINNGLKFGVSLFLSILSFKTLFDGLNDLTVANSLLDKAKAALKMALGGIGLAATLGLSGSSLLMVAPLTLSFAITWDFVNKGGLEKLQKVVDKIKETSNGDVSPFSWFNSLLASLKELFTPSSATLGSGAFAKASGGFVNSGEMFIAREAGPEMVGTIGNHTAVANNDQIVEGISSGVYSAVVAAMKSTSGESNAHYTIMLDSRVVYESVVQADKQTVKRTGQSAFAN